MGLFADMDGIPLAFCINPGNTAEITTLKKLEGRLQDLVTQTTGWKLVDFSAKNGPMLSKEEYDLTQLNPDE